MIDLRLGDAFAPDGLPSLADASVDVTITDPPFDVRTHEKALEGRDWRGGDRKVGSALPFAPFDEEMIARTAHELVRVTKRWILVFAADRQLEQWAQALETSGARVVRFGIAERTNPRPQMSGDRPGPSADLIVIAHRAGERMRWNGGGKAARWASPAARWDTDRKNIHPCQKPEALMRALVQDFSDPGELVLDPFAGSGTTAVVCKELGRRFLGWERDPGWHADSARRIERAREQLTLGQAHGRKWRTG